MKPWRMQSLQALNHNEKGARSNSFVDCLGIILYDEIVTAEFVFVGETTFPVSGKVNTHNCRICGLGNKRVYVELQRDSLKVNMLCALSEQKLYGPFFVAEITITGVVHLNKLRNYLWPQLSEDLPQGLIHVKQNGAPSLCHWEMQQ
jgi:hypothetical protein